MQTLVQQFKDVFSLAALLPDQPVAGGARPRAEQREGRPPGLLYQRQPGRDGPEAEGAGVALVRRAAVLAGQLDRRCLEAEAEQQYEVEALIIYMLRNS